MANAISGGGLQGSMTDQVLQQAFPGPDYMAQAQGLAQSATTPFSTLSATASTFDPAMDPGQPFIVGFWAARLGARNARLQMEMQSRAEAMDPGDLLRAISTLQQSNQSLQESINQLSRTGQETTRALASSESEIRQKLLTSIQKYKSSANRQRVAAGKAEGELFTKLYEILEEGRQEIRASEMLSSEQGEHLDLAMGEVRGMYVHGGARDQDAIQRMQLLKSSLMKGSENRAMRGQALNLLIYDHLRALDVKDTTRDYESLYKAWAALMMYEDVEKYRSMARLQVDAQRKEILDTESKRGSDPPTPEEDREHITLLVRASGLSRAEQDDILGPRHESGSRRGGGPR